MSLLSDLEAARAGAAAKLAACLRGDYSSALEFKPGFNGSSAMDRATYVRELRQTLNDLKEEIAAAQGPVTVETIGLV